MIDGSIQGKVFAKPQERAGKSGKSFVTAKLTAAAGDGESLCVNVIAFGADACCALLAQRHGAEAHDMAKMARRAAVGENSLCRSLNENGNPTISTLHRVLHAMGLHLSVTPEQA